MRAIFVNTKNPIIANRGGVIGIKTVAYKMMAVKTIETILRTDPHKTCVVLQKCFNVIVGQAINLLIREKLKIVLCHEAITGQQYEQEAKMSYTSIPVVYSVYMLQVHCATQILFQF